jgi:hypothetical protein
MRHDKKLIARFWFAGQWYTEIIDYIQKTYADSTLFAGLLAATSPRKTVRENWKLANRIYREHKAGKPYSRRGLLPAHTGNVDRAIAGQELSGPKVRAFRENLSGNPARVTVDIWIMRYYGMKNESPTAKEYLAIERDIVRQARRFNTTPAGMQAIFWTIARYNAGLSPSSFTGETKQQTFDFMED